jgi:hypothetical protein
MSVREAFQQRMCEIGAATEADDESWNLLDCGMIQIVIDRPALRVVLFFHPTSKLHNALACTTALARIGSTNQ